MCIRLYVRIMYNRCGKTTNSEFSDDYCNVKINDKLKCGGEEFKVSGGSKQLMADQASGSNFARVIGIGVNIWFEQITREYISLSALSMAGGEDSSVTHPFALLFYIFYFLVLLYCVLTLVFYPEPKKTYKPSDSKYLPMMLL